MTLANSQQQSLLRLAARGISVSHFYPFTVLSCTCADGGPKVYCPHTAVDAAPGGLGDWLADIVTGNLADASEQSSIRSAQPSPLPTGSSEQADPFVEKRPMYMLRHHPSKSGSSLRINDLRLYARPSSVWS